MILKDPEPTVRVGEHLDSGVQIKVFAWATPDDYYEVYFFLQENVKKEFDKKRYHNSVPSSCYCQRLKLLNSKLNITKNSVNNNGAVDSVPFYFYKD